MSKQVRHYRTSVKGKKFVAGTRSPREVTKEKREINILDTTLDYEPSQDELEKVMEDSGCEDKTLVKEKLLECGGDIDLAVEELKEDLEIDDQPQEDNIDTV